MRSHTEKLLEILAKAEIDEEIIEENNKDTPFNYSFQEEFIKQNKIEYCGRPLHKIYEANNNFGNGKGSLITFKVKQNGLKRVKEDTRLFITTDINLEDKAKHIFFIGNINFPKQEHKAYFSPNVDITNTAKKNKYEYKNAYTTLNELINDEKYSHLWKKNNTTKKITEDYIDKLLENEEHSMIDILDKKDAENTYSNFFYHIFDSNHELFKEFTKYLNKKIKMSNNFTIAREEGTKTGRIDLLIYDDKNVIVIENKIKSDINGKGFDNEGNLDTTQLDKYYEYVNLMATITGKDKKEKEEKQKEYEAKFKGKNKFYYIFAPKYSRIAQEERIDLKKYIKQDSGAYYTVITYDKLYKFFEDRRNEYLSELSKLKIPYFGEFLYALKKHSNLTDNHYETDMLKRFVKVIRKMIDEKSKNNHNR